MRFEIHADTRLLRQKKYYMLVIIIIILSSKRILDALHSEMN